MQARSKKWWLWCEIVVVTARPSADRHYLATLHEVHCPVMQCLILPDVSSFSQCLYLLKAKPSYGFTSLEWMLSEFVIHKWVLFFSKGVLHFQRPGLRLSVEDSM